MATSDDSIRPPAQQLPDQLAEVRQRRQKHAGPRPAARRSQPLQTTSRDPSPPDGVKRPDRDRRLIGALVTGGLGIDEPAPDDVLDAITGAPTSLVPPPMAPDTTADDVVDARIDKPATDVKALAADAPDADNWLRHHHERYQPQRAGPIRPRGSAELPTEPTRAARGGKRVSARPLASPKATVAGKTGDRSRRRSTHRWVIAAVPSLAILVIAIVVIGNFTTGHKTRTNRTAARVRSDGWRGGDPRSSEHPVFAPPVEFRSAHLGAAAVRAGRFVARPIHHRSAPVSPARSSTASGSVQTSSSDEPAEVTSTPHTTYTAPPTTTTPTSSTGSGGASGTTSSGGSSNSSSTKKTPAYGPAGSLGPGSSPDS